MDTNPTNLEQIFFGATVKLENEQQQVNEYRIVGPDEFDRQSHYISMDSPLARGLLKRELGDKVKVEVPEGIRQYFIISIAY